MENVFMNMREVGNLKSKATTAQENTKKEIQFCLGKIHDEQLLSLGI